MEAQLIKAAARGREAAERRGQQRRKELLVLILRHLLDHGYIDSCQRLSEESNTSLAKVDVADNVDLLRILQEYEQAQEALFGKRPKLVKQLDERVQQQRQVSRLPSLIQHSEATAAASAGISPTHPISGQLAAKQRRDKAAAAAAAGAPASPATGVSGGQPASSQHPPRQRARRDTAGACAASSSNSSSGGQPPDEHGTTNRQQQPGSTAAAGTSTPLEFQLNGSTCTAVSASNPAGKGSSGRSSGRDVRAAAGNSSDGDDDGDSDGFHESRLLKPLPTSLLGELRELGSAISRDIYTASPNVHWSDIAGLDEAKRLLKESMVLPLKYRAYFTGLLAPWRGLLLYGPPGTGKTLLAKAVATQCRTTFFNISASSIISKWRGDSEKLVRVLFDLARHHAPSTVFLDEVDALMGARGAEGEHEASRRMKTELLIQMDGLARSQTAADQAQVFVLAATNMPWELDMALLRRLEKRILVPLPSLAARRAMLGQLLQGRAGPGADLDQLAAATEGFSGSDVAVVAKEAAMRPLRRLMAVLEPSVYSSGSSSSSSKGDGAASDASLCRRNGSSINSSRRAGDEQAAGPVPPVELGPVTAEDLAAALAVTKPSAQAYESRYQEFNAMFGTTL